jgi:4a-hydroxytetrahydrobiopterin dehydratase
MAASPRIARSVFAERYPLADWRVIGRSLVADFLAPTFAGAIAFVGDVGGAADAADHHPDIDIRYPGHVRIILTTHAANGLTEADASLAQRISALANDGALTVTINAVASTELAIDAMDIAAVLPFWRAILGYADEQPFAPDGIADAIIDPLRIGPSMWFQQMDAPRPQRNRIHFDLLVPHDEAANRIAAAVAAGGTVINAEEAPAFWVLADPEGNEICVCTWQGRD